MTAHVTFADGGLVLPARTPYDRQLLRDHIMNGAQRGDRVRVSVAGETWIVERPGENDVPGCEGCQRLLTAAALRRPESDAAFCVACVLS